MESTRRDVTSRVARHAGKLAVLLLALLLASCSSDVSPLEDLASSADAREARPQPGELVSFVVERAVDGGTVEIAGELHR
ncbi:MAG: hypothetical protein M3R38_17235, partial [Actinomycetota bacterium]|nr:hypothetical protein [Actinomycetota bacterium]